MATHSSIFAWKIPWTEEPVTLQSMEKQKTLVDQSPWRSPLKEPGGLESMEKSMDRRACEARVLGVAEADRTE